MTEGPATIGGNVAEAIRRSTAVKNQNQLAKALNVPASKISDLVRDRYDSPDVFFLARVAMALGCSLDDFLHGVEGFDKRDLSRHTGSATMPPSPGGQHDGASSSSPQGGRLQPDHSPDFLAEAGRIASRLVVLIGEEKRRRETRRVKRA